MAGGHSQGVSVRILSDEHGARAVNSKVGVVYLVGAGPGDPGLITVRGRRLIEEADVLLHDRLVGGDLLAGARSDADVIDVRKTFGHGERAQAEISRYLVDRARRVDLVVRLKGGDPFVLSRGWEEWQACRDAGVPCVVVPGVTSALAVPATVGIPVTHRGISRTFAVMTARGRNGDDVLSPTCEALAKIDTIVILMGRSNLGEVTRALMAAGRAPATPAACIEQGTTPRARSVVATLAAITDAVERAALRAPVVTVVGHVAKYADEYRQALHAFVDPSSDHRKPLSGKRVLVTRSSDSMHELCECLSAMGATPIKSPLIRVDFPPGSDAIDSAIRKLECYDWIAFTSVHGVRGFFAGLTRMGRDARALAPCKVAAIGPITAAALRRRGVVPDLVPEPYSATALTEDLLKELAGSPGRVLCPRGNIAGPELPQELRCHGVVVDEVVTYHTVSLTPPESVLGTVRDGVDAILFCSPSSAARLAELRLDTAGAVIGCIGPSTASAAREAGMRVDVEAEECTDAGLVVALSRHFSAGGGQP